MSIGKNKGKLRQLRTFFLNGTLIIFGLVVGLCCVEFGLTLSGKILLSWQSFQYRTISKKYFSPVKVKKSFKILCLGDSSTYGRGVEISYSYPFQLSRLLNQQSPSFEVSVISTGGINMSQLTNRYENFLKTDNYDLVIFQAGVNDVHRFRECKMSLYTKNYNLQWVTDSKLFNLIKSISCKRRLKKFGRMRLHVRIFQQQQCSSLHTGRLRARLQLNIHLPGCIGSSLITYRLSLN